LTPLRFEVPQLAVKRSMDLLFVVAGFAVLWPLFVIIALMIKLDSKGPVLFRQTRAGLGGKPFEMFKFRTMVDGADLEKPRLQHLNESHDPRLFKIRRDPRVTRVGRILRRSSLDELPQILNVARGEMSLVGPRPFFPSDLSGYQGHHFERLHVLPGITGLWQVSGRSDVVDFEEVIRLDRQYIRNWTLLADLSILLRTIPAALRRGAY
jgi:lipopolysaccharide/colanic/teichoic acid biosynthesis glycosyltransferase